MPGSLFPEGWRPDKVGFIIQPAEWAGGRFWLVHHMEQDPPEEILAAMRQHTKATGEPHVISKKTSWLVWGKPEFQEAMIQRRKARPLDELQDQFVKKPVDGPPGLVT